MPPTNYAQHIDKDIKRAAERVAAATSAIVSRTRNSPLMYYITRKSTVARKEAFKRLKRFLIVIVVRRLNCSTVAKSVVRRHDCCTLACNLIARNLWRISSIDPLAFYTTPGFIVVERELSPPHFAVRQRIEFANFTLIDEILPPKQSVLCFTNPRQAVG